MHAEALAQHKWLHKLIGDWRMEADCDMGPDKPREITKGTDHVRALGDAWVLIEGDMESPTTPSKSVMTLGYDPAKNKFVGTFITSCMHMLWIYDDGTLDEAANRLTLCAEGPSFSGDGTITKYQDIIEFINDDHRVLRSQYPLPDGTWHQFMEAHYYRVAK